MPDPSTTRLALYKSKSDGSEDVDYTQDIGQNWDRVDAAVGFASCTSSTRPSSPYSGKAIMETDTSYRTFFSNGTSPASASWVEIPNGSAQYNSTLRLASGKQINVNSSASSATIAVVNAATTTDLISARVTGDTVDRFEVETDGTHNWGPGASGALDTNLFRSAANTLRTNDNLTVDLNLTVSGSAAITGAASVGGDLAVADTTWQTYTPTVNNAGTATWSTRTGWYKKIGKIVIIEIYLASSAAGSGTTAITLSLPSTPFRDGNGAASTRQYMGAHAGGVAAGTNSSISGPFAALVFAGGSGALLDRITGPTALDMRGENIGSALVLTIQGWYREA